MKYSLSFTLKLAEAFFKSSSQEMKTWWIMPDGNLINLEGQYHGLYLAHQQGMDTTHWDISDIEDMSSRFIDEGGITLRVMSIDPPDETLFAHANSIDESVFSKVKSALNKIDLNPSSKVFIYAGPGYSSESIATNVSSIMVAKSLRDLKKHLDRFSLPTY